MKDINTHKLIPYSFVLVILLFSGCKLFEFGPNAFERLPEKIATDKEYEYSGKVIIVGAGASGLAAAKILEQNGINYQIVEATYRYGGRLKKVEGFADFPIDIGAEWIHNKQEILNKLKGKNGSEVTEELIPYRLESSSIWNGESLKPVSQKRLNNYFEGFTEYKFKNSTWYDFVDENFAHVVKHKIQYNSPIVAIDYRNDKVELTIKGGEKLTGDKVLVTVPIGILKSGMIDFVPNLDKQKTKAIESVSYLPGFKLALKFSQTFYPNVVSCKTQNGSKEFYDYAYKKDSENHILGLLSTGSSAEDYYKLETKEAIVDSVIGELDFMFDGKASKFYTGEFLYQDWGNHTYTQGTWSTSLFNQSLLEALNRPLDHKVYFAGGANDLYRQGGVPGSIISGYTAIDRLLMEAQ